MKTKGHVLNNKNLWKDEENI